MQTEIETEINENLRYEISLYYYHASKVIEHLKSNIYLPIFINFFYLFKLKTVIVDESILQKFKIKPMECSVINEFHLDKVDYMDYDLDPFQIVIDTKRFLIENKIKEEAFYQNILQTTYLSFKIFMNFPHEWPKLNQIFKSYYKRAFLFLNNQNHKSIFINKPDNITNCVDYQSEQGNFIVYDISQEFINEDDSKRIINYVVKKLRGSNLTK